MRAHKSSGFTLIELIVVVALLAILAAWVVPGFQGLIARTTLDSEAERVWQAVRSARAEAVERRSTVRVCPTEDESGCSSDWSDPLMIFVDMNDDGTRSDNEELIRVSQRSGNAEVDITAGGLSTGVSYQPSGFTKTTKQIISFESNELVADEARGICIESARASSGSLSMAQENCS